MYCFPCKELVIAKMGSNCILFNNFGIPPICTYTQHRAMLGCSGSSITNVCHMLWLWTLQGNRRASLIGNTVWMQEKTPSFLLWFWWSTSSPCPIQSGWKTTTGFKVSWVSYCGQPSGNACHIQWILIIVCLYSWNRSVFASLLLSMFNICKYLGSPKSETIAQTAHFINPKGIHWCKGRLN